MGKLGLSRIDGFNVPERVYFRTSTASVSVTVNPVNDDPVAVDDGGFATAFETQLQLAPAALLGNDTDVDGDPLAIASVGNAVNGTVVLFGGDVIFTPDAGYSGPASFEYTVSDGNGGTDTGLVTLSVGSNASPVAGDDTTTTDEDVPVDIDVLANDTDLDGDPLTVLSVTQGANGAVTVNADGTVRYTPDADFNGSDSFEYTVSDGNGGTDTGLVEVTVSPVNDDPVAADDAAATDEDVPVDIAVLANDTDVDGDTVAVSGVTQGANGTVTVNADGTVRYTPDADFNGSDSFTYDISDGNGGTSTASVSVTVNPVNDAPLILSSDFLVAENTTDVGAVLATDPDGDALSYAIVGGADEFQFDIDATGQLSFKSAPDFEAPADADGNNVYEVDVQVSDGALATVETMFVTVANDPSDDGGGPGLPEIVGTQGFDYLVGTADAEIFRSLGGLVDIMQGGGGADVFEFGDELANFTPETDYIMDFGADDTLDLGDASVNMTFVWGGSTYIYAGADNDLIVLFGYDEFDPGTQYA